MMAQIALVTILSFCPALDPNTPNPYCGYTCKAWQVQTDPMARVPTCSVPALCNPTIGQTFCGIVDPNIPCEENTCYVISVPDVTEVPCTLDLVTNHLTMLDSDAPGMLTYFVAHTEICPQFGACSPCDCWDVWWNPVLTDGEVICLWL
jgi:hypothetical protein